MTAEPFARIDLHFGTDAASGLPAGFSPDDFRDDLSACCLVPTGDGDGRLWLASDELAGLSALAPTGPGGFGDHVYLGLGRLLDLPDGPREEIDIEGLDFADGRLWLTGSHTSTRGKLKPAKEGPTDLKPLAEVRRRRNRFLIGCLSLDSNGRPAPGARLEHLPFGKRGNTLTEALRQDPHLGPYLHNPGRLHGGRDLQLPSKENGFDIEGLAVHGERLFLGLRGPVLRGWSLILEIAVKPRPDGTLKLKRIGPGGRRYRKHFVSLGGMGTRDLVFHGPDLLILAGPTMDIPGFQRVWRLRNALDLGDDSVTDAGPALAPPIELPWVPDGDKAEGLALYRGPECEHPDEPALLVVYDAPVPARRLGADGVRADLFRLPA